MQVSQLVCKMKEESKEGVESITRKHLQVKIAALSQPRLTRAVDTLAMVWNGVKEPLEPLIIPKFSFDATPILPNWHRVKFALLKSILTGTFVDVQFYAYNAIGNKLPLDPKPLYASSIAIEEWSAAITTRK